jgi:hypothetical protein
MFRSVHLWVRRGYWLLLAISLIAVAYVFGPNYTSCRMDGTGKIACFFIALILSYFEVLIFVVVGIGKLLLLILP